MLNFAFFGTDEFAVGVLEQLKNKNFLPSLIITTPDKPKGRKLVLTPPPVKIWAENNKIKYLQPEKLKEFKLENNSENSFEIFVVASYGKIIPKNILDLPTFGTLNLHPSLLPKYRGPTPIQTAILNSDKEPETGISVMLVDEEVDHGPVLVAASCELGAMSFLKLREKLAKLGADLLAEVMPKWTAGEIEAQAQDHAQATFTKKINKSAGEIILDEKNSEINYRKFLAYTPWPGIYFFDQQNKRVKITAASLENNVFVIKKVVPEGRPEMRWEDWERGLARNY
ncbi:MAG: methionyl-tRNA formyltransferase [Patescibacteria group bacterium]